MKRINFLLFFTLIYSSSFGQKIHFTDSANIWNMYYVNGGDDVLTGYPVVNKYVGDTVIHGITYKTLFCHGTGFHNSIAYVREDFVSSKVYAIYPIKDTDTVEKVLYDYTLQVGDTFNSGYDKSIVSMIDSVQINTLWYKVWHFNGSSIGTIEGIGSLLGPNTPLDSIVSPEERGHLRCFINSGNTFPLSTKIDYYFDNNSSCISTFGVNEHVDVKSVFSENTQLSILPNPINKASKLVLPESLASGMFVVQNIIGQTIVNSNFQNKKEIIFGDKIKLPGIYFYRVTDNQSKAIYSGKFISN